MARKAKQASEKPIETENKKTRQRIKVLRNGKLRLAWRDV